MWEEKSKESGDKNARILPIPPLILQGSILGLILFINLKNCDSVDKKWPVLIMEN